MKQKQKLNRAVVISLILHFSFLLALIIGAITQDTRLYSGNEGMSIDAIMVDQSILSQQYQRTQQQKNQAEQAKKAREQALEAQDRLLKEEQDRRQAELKALEKERLEAQAQADQAALKKQQEEAEVAKAQALKQAAEEAVKRQQAQIAIEQAAIEKARREAEEDAKVKAQQAQQEKALAEQKLKEAEAIQQKAKAEAEKIKREAEKQRKKAAEEAKKQAEQAKTAKKAKEKQNKLDDLFGDLASTKNDPTKSGGAAAGQKDIDAYNTLIRQAIQSKFKDPGIYRGKVCELSIKIAPDGLLLDVKAKSGDAALCREAIVAAKTAVIPKPPNRAIYEKFKNATLEFQP